MGAHLLSFVKRNRHIHVLLIALVTTGCAGILTRAQVPPAHQISTSQFILAAEYNLAEARDSVHVYLSGDGRVRDGWGRPLSDPTPRHSLALDLARQDSSHAIFMGRPCQYVPDQPGCEPRLWTSARYGQQVVDVMCEGLNAIAEESKKPLTLIGFSGGGAIAVLASHCAPAVVQIVTINGNLDTDFWAATRQFIPPQESINPIDRGLGKNVSVSAYLAGALDEVVPPEVSVRFAERHEGIFRVLPDNAHVTGWVDQWPSILEELEVALPSW